jgi:hypothetical protein
MKKFYYIILAILILVSIYFGFFYRKIDIENYKYSIEDTTKITSFEISDSNEKIQITKHTEGWIVNNSYHANQQLVKQFLRVFSNLELSTLVSDERLDSTSKFLYKKGINVKFYKNNKLTNEYWIGEFNNSLNSTLAMNDDEVVAYISSPGLSNNIRKFLDTDNIFWRDKIIFNLDPIQVSSVELKDPRNIENSFLIEKNGNKYQIINSVNKSVNFNEDNLLRYLSYFRNIRFESVIEDFSQQQKDSIKKAIPLISIIVKTNEGRNTQLNLYTKADNKNPNETDLNYVYAILNNEQLVLMISYFQIDPILKKIEYFK